MSTSISLSAMPPLCDEPLWDAAWLLGEYCVVESAVPKGKAGPGCCAKAVAVSTAMPAEASSGKESMYLRLHIALRLSCYAEMMLTSFDFNLRGAPTVPGAEQTIVK